MGVGIDPLTVEQLLAYVADFIEQEEHALITCVNVYGYNLAVDHPWLIDCWNKSEIVFCDGAGVILGARLLGKTIPERITYADWYWRLVQLAESAGFSLFLLGGEDGIADEAAEVLRRLHPHLRIVGVHHGFFDKTPGSPENEAVIRQINEAKPDILTVGMGMPVQERWLYDNWDRLDAHVALTGGAVFGYVSGNLTRAPRWMTDHGLEWLGRMLVEPGRLWQRYLIGNPQFFYRVLKQRLKFT
jgi:N-acetylglucosaminyldiphosphoundecaprenol N-acetyl-beta-D-mannosaminyltransferase